ncbi:hypothetical protein S40285_09066 [Stachybotrys chlorohalonatus IBT 40285]|uniref:Major facilitator superfamily (MFS) profile domain-containing protein n=1 Tax=Stachybotrys chlorohalonatus (strain IBT 40285) TaxID=1283841 RepID=A0A084QM02_STAC4|nr:hypothetical protein S40285_09066 [Stachybotrys chlorohalonata IBT 40285]
MMGTNNGRNGVFVESQEQPHITPSPKTERPPAPYSIYNRKEKWILVGIVGVAGLFSPLPANIYLPAIPTLTTVFNRSIEDLNLTVTIYLAMQGCSPMLWGPLSDRYGRRPLFLFCLLILIGSSLGLALCPTEAFWLLLLLRATQAGGCASMIALGAGTIGDIASVDERGGFFGIFNLGPMLAPCIGPAVGGALSEHLGWRSIFWFLTLFSAACFIMIMLFLPETTRALVGNGSIKLANFVYLPLLAVVDKGRSKVVKSNKHAQLVTEELNLKTRASANPFRLLIYPDVALLLVYTGIVYAVNYTIMSTISSSFTIAYPFLTETLIGICYLPTGLGMIIGSTVTGKFLDFEYAKIKKTRDAIGKEDSSTDDLDQGFPIELSRLRMVPILLVVFVGCTIGWGWCIQTRSHVAGPLVLQVFLGWTSIAILNSTMTLMIDIIRDQSSGAIACLLCLYH